MSKYCLILMDKEFWYDEIIFFNKFCNVYGQELKNLCFSFIN